MLLTLSDALPRQQATTSLASFAWSVRRADSGVSSAAEGAVPAAWPSIEDGMAGLGVSGSNEAGLRGLSQAELKAILLKTLCEDGMDAVVARVRRALDAK